MQPFVQTNIAADIMAYRQQGIRQWIVSLIIFPKVKTKLSGVL